MGAVRGRNHASTTLLILEKKKILRSKLKKGINIPYINKTIAIVFKYNKNYIRI
jgi:hypothetical protein